MKKFAFTLLFILGLASIAIADQTSVVVQGGNIDYSTYDLDVNGNLLMMPISGHFGGSDLSLSGADLNLNNELVSQAVGNNADIEIGKKGEAFVALGQINTVDQTAIAVQLGEINKGNKISGLAMGNSAQIENAGETVLLLGQLNTGDQTSMVAQADFNYDVAYGAGVISMYPIFGFGYIYDVAELGIGGGVNINNDLVSTAVGNNIGVKNTGEMLALVGQVNTSTQVAGAVQLGAFNKGNTITALAMGNNLSVNNSGALGLGAVQINR